MRDAPKGPPYTAIVASLGQARPRGGLDPPQRPAQRFPERDPPPAPYPAPATDGFAIDCAGPAVSHAPPPARTRVGPPQKGRSTVNSFVVCVGAVLPIFILMAVGYLCQRLGVIKREAVPAMNKVAFTVFLSTMVFNSIYTSDLAASVDPFLLAYTAVAAIAVFAAATAVVNATVPVENQKGVMVQGMFRSNFVMVGLAVAENLLPPGEMGTVAVLVAVIIPVYNVLAVVTLSAHGGEATSWTGVVRKIATNPLIIATVLALAMAALGLRLPAVLERCVAQMAAVSTPLMLFLLGAFFEFKSLPRYGRQLATVCLFRLVLVPAVVLGIAVALGIGSTGLVALLAVFATATAIASFTMAQQMGGDAELAGNIVVATSVLCPFTIFAFAYGLMSLGLITG